MFAACLLCCKLTLHSRMSAQLQSVYAGQHDKILQVRAELLQQVGKAFAAAWDKEVMVVGITNRPAVCCQMYF